VLLITGATVAGALLWSGGSEGTAVWRAVRDLPAGAQVGAGDVESIVVIAPEGTSYVIAEKLPEGRLTRPIAAGELLPANSTSTSAPSDVRLVTVPVEPMHAPVDLGAGSVVDVWVTAEGDIGGAGTSELVLERVRVDAVAADADGVSGTIAVVLEVSTRDAPALIAAVRSGALDLVAVPAVP
jgi:Flp pilus assembly protein CpaB